MTKRALFISSCFVCLLQSFAAVTEDAWTIHEVEIVGAERTSPVWLKTYIGFPFLEKLTPVDLETIRRKLLTTQVFLSVQVQTEKVKDDKDEYLLKITLDEKWTTIPVVRGVYGGGTPLAIFGVYDTHTFGSLWTLGGETHRYGSEPIGGVVWAKAPRFYRGNHSIGFEFWREFRLRTIYDTNDDKLGSIQSSFSMFRLFFLAPVKLPWGLFHNSLRAGMDARVREHSPATFKYETGGSVSGSTLYGIRLNEAKVRQTQTLLRTEYDDMTVDQLLHDGTRMIIAAGPQFETNSGAFLTEAEGFYYWQGWPDGNLASHFFTGNTQSYSLESQYFLGGLDSVRGLPDGALYGRRAAYVNLELRQIVSKLKRLQTQSVLFYDAGAAGENWPEAGKNIRSSVGLGFRFSIPQIYRFLIRVDYAWNLEDSKTQGISLGMNELFQPYKPL